MWFMIIIKCPQYQPISETLLPSAIDSVSMLPYLGTLG